MLRRLDLPVLAAILLAGAVFARTRGPEASWDIWWHMQTGQWIVTHGAVPKTDPFSYSKADARWIAHEWATDVLLYELYERWGLYGLALFRQVVATASAVLLYLLCTGGGAHPLVAYVAGLLLIQFLGPTLNARPQVLLPLLFLTAVHLLGAHRRGRKWAIWGIPVLALVWANVHGGFVVLYTTLGMYALDRLLAGGGDAAGSGWRLRDRLNPQAFGGVVVVGLVAVLATLVNPNGVAGAVYPLEYFVGGSKWSTSIVEEFASPDFSKAYMAVPGLALVALIGLLLVSRAAPTLFEGLLLVFFTYSFLRWQRMVGIYGVVVLAALAQHVTEYFRLRYRPSAGPSSPVLVGSLLVVGALLFVVGWPWLFAVEKMVDTERYPGRALEAARLNGVRGNLLNTYHYGGYIIWQTYPERVVFIDGRADMYGKTHYEEYQTMVYAEPGWQEALRHWDIAWVLLERERPLVKVLRERADWHVLYGDRTNVAMVRDGPPNAALVRRIKAGQVIRPPATVLPRGAGGRRGADEA